jgi:ribosomal protein S12 methylthiotransferase accessory factor
MTESIDKWAIKHTPKRGRTGASRIILPSQTVKNLKPLLQAMQILDPGDIMRVDTDGIPVFVCKRSGADGRAFYYKGKGYTGADSRASAMMEAAERYSAETYSGSVLSGTYEEIQRKGPAAHLEKLYARIEECYTHDSTVEWVQGFDLIGQRETFIPLNLVVQPYVTGPEYFRAGSVGLASGNTMEEALAHALCEVIEHDALGVSATYNPESWRFVMNDSQGGAQGATQEIPFEDTTPELAFPLIDPATFPARASNIAHKLDAAGLEFFARNITTDIGAASVSCIVAARNAQGAYAMFSGSGTHPNADIALVRALCEAAQSHSAGMWLYENKIWKQQAMVENPGKLAGYGSTCAFSDIPSRKFPTVDQDIHWLLGRLRRDGLNQAIAADLTSPDLGIPTVRVTVPGTEYLHEEPDKKGMGMRAKAMLDKRMNQLNELFQNYHEQNNGGRP